MTAEVIRHPALQTLLCDFCQGSPCNGADFNVAVELKGGPSTRFHNRTWTFALHCCRSCRQEFFKPVTPGLVRVDDGVNFGAVTGVFAFLPPRRLQRKRR